MRTRKNKYVWYYVAAAIFLLYVCFFSMERTEISDVNVVRILGIDYINGEYTLTALYNQNGGADTAAGGVVLISGTGSSPYAAYNDLVLKNQKDVSIAHTAYYILGNSLAEYGISDALDFFEREQTVKTNASIFLLKDNSVKDFMQTTVDDEVMLHDDLASINTKQLDQLKKIDNTISYVMAVVNDKEYTLLLPYIVYQDKKVIINGYSAFNKDKLQVYLDQDTSTAVDFFRNRLRDLPIILDNNVGVLITDSKISKKIDIVNGKLRANFKIHFQSDIKEVNKADAIYETYDIEQIELLQDKYIQNMLIHIINLSEENKVDLLDLKRETRNQCAKDWDVISSRWNTYFKQMEYKYNISSQTAQSYVVGR